jgi:SAM-dependent methyltransferase
MSAETGTMNHLLVAPEDWDNYWNKKNRGGILYALVAEFYRKFIIRPHLNRFIRKNFSAQSVLLHAGCGSGQVDRDIKEEYRLIGLDFSKRGLEVYQETNSGKCQTLLSDITKIDLPDESVDGVYNLGVMEHLNDREILQSMREFHRVLKPGGRIVLFWPPEYGLSVLFFKALRKVAWVLTLGRDVKFHPDEISRIPSKEKAYEWVSGGGITPLSYSFGPKDLFTYSVIVGEKPLK